MAKRSQRRRAKFDTSNESTVVQGEFGGRKKFNLKDLANVVPLTDNQERFFDLWDDEGVELLVASGFAGCGKTYLAMYCALKQVLDEDYPQDKIILVRSAVQSRDIGFTSGDDKQKASVFESPYHTICKNLLPNFNSGYDHLKSLGYVEFHLTSFMRGDTYDNAIVILDEAASCNYHELSTVTTRLGINSRLIICGDIKQDDLASKGRKSDTSGFKQYLNTINRMPEEMVGIVNYGVEDIVRSGLVKQFLIADQS